MSSGPHVISDVDATGSEEGDKGGVGVVEWIVSPAVYPDRQVLEPTLASSAEDVVAGEVSGVVNATGALAR